MRVNAEHDWVLLPDSSLDRLVIRSLIAATLNQDSEREAWGYVTAKIGGEMADDGSLPVILTEFIPPDGDAMAYLARRPARADARLCVFGETYNPEAPFSWDAARLILQFRFKGEDWTSDLRQLRAEFADPTTSSGRPSEGI